MGKETAWIGDYQLYCIDGKERRAAAGMYKDYMFTRSKKALREQVQKTGEGLAGVYRVSFASGDEEVIKRYVKNQGGRIGQEKITHEGVGP
ncbi:MAG: hypothetical protein LBG24_02875 [Treponema sp.]|jgi:hypothetical protein|nr:hypothetical protein [Treponema sp.]